MPYKKGIGRKFKNQERKKGLASKLKRTKDRADKEDLGILQEFAEIALLHSNSPRETANYEDDHTTTPQEHESTTTQETSLHDQNDDQITPDKGHDLPAYQLPSENSTVREETGAQTTIPVLNYSLPHTSIREGLSMCFLPPGWIYQADANSIHLLYIINASVLKNITVTRDLLWSVSVYNVQCEKKKTLSTMPKIVNSVSMVLTILDKVHHGRVCMGNPDPKFLELSKARQGTFKKSGREEEVVGYQHVAPLPNRRGEILEATIRSAQCQMLLDNDKERCGDCSQFRNSLFAMHHRYRTKRETDERQNKTKHSSHVPLSALSHEELYERVHDIIKEKRRIERREERLRQKLQASIEKNGRGEILEATIRSAQCGDCSQFRNSLFAMHHRHRTKRETDGRQNKTKHSSNVPLSALSHEELYERTQDIIREMRRIEMREERLRQKLQASIEKDGIVLDHELADDSEKMVTDCEESGGSMELPVWYTDVNVPRYDLSLDG
ncbi:uncharacterized protein [Ptychodera flava]|uniref:uncharacterized protein n=1 Tax=Ptychodera flava TaxID=63121 RepID=UPI00396A8915